MGYFFENIQWNKKEIYFCYGWMGCGISHVIYDRKEQRRLSAFFEIIIKRTELCWACLYDRGVADCKIFRRIGIEYVSGI